jgi:signal transduction histidine kinase
MQLAENAAGHTSDGGVIRIGSAADGATVRLWVHDDGPGVAPEDAELIFDRFVRGAQRVDGGAGLGLSIVQAIVAAHGGSVRLDQSVASGARFEITLPRPTA